MAWQGGAQKNPPVKAGVVPGGVGTLASPLSPSDRVEALASPTLGVNIDPLENDGEATP